MRGKTSLRHCILVLIVLFLVAPPAYPQSTPERINAVYASITTPRCMWRKTWDSSQAWSRR